MKSKVTHIYTLHVAFYVPNSHPSLCVRLWSSKKKIAESNQFTFPTNLPILLRSRQSGVRRKTLDDTRHKLITDSADYKHQSKHQSIRKPFKLMQCGVLQHKLEHRSSHRLWLFIRMLMSGQLGYVTCYKRQRSAQTKLANNALTLLLTELKMA